MTGAETEVDALITVGSTDLFAEGCVGAGMHLSRYEQVAAPKLLVCSPLLFDSEPCFARSWTADQAGTDVANRRPWQQSSKRLRPRRPAAEERNKNLRSVSPPIRRLKIAAQPWNIV